MGDCLDYVWLIGDGGIIVIIKEVIGDFIQILFVIGYVIQEWDLVLVVEICNVVFGVYFCWVVLVYVFVLEMFYFYYFWFILVWVFFEVGQYVDDMLL